MTQFKIFVGIDWSTKTHQVVAFLKKEAQTRRPFMQLKEELSQAGRTISSPSRAPDVEDMNYIQCNVNNQLTNDLRNLFSISAG